MGKEKHLGRGNRKNQMISVSAAWLLKGRKGQAGSG